jgi:predicted  nucleic acid-binding Zn-ribbon protein
VAAQIKSKMRSELSLAADEIRRYDRALREREEFVSPAEHGAAKDEVKRAAEQVKALKEDSQRKSKLLAAIKSDKTELELALKTLKAEKESVDERLKRALREAKAHEASAKDLRSKAEKVTTQDAGLGGEITRLQDKVKVLERDVQRKDGIAKEFKAKVAELQDQNESLQRKVDGAKEGKEALKKMKSDLERRTEAANALKGKIEQLNSELRATKDSVKAAEAREAKGQRQLSARASEWEVILNRCSVLEDAVRRILHLVLSEADGIANDLYGAGGAGTKRLGDHDIVVERLLDADIDSDHLVESLQSFIRTRVKLEVDLNVKEQNESMQELQVQEKQQQQQQAGQGRFAASKGTRVGAAASGKSETKGESLRQSVQDIQAQLGLSGFGN